MLAINKPAVYGSSQNIALIPADSRASDGDEKNATFTSYVRRKRPGQQSAPANLNKRGSEGLGRQLK